jgi:hypothetical protein
MVTNCKITRIISKKRVFMKSSLRKGISLVLAALLLLSFAACGSKGEEQKTTEPSK